MEKIAVEGAILNPEISFVDLEKILSIFGKAQIGDSQIVYHPYWAFKTSKNRKIAVDALTGKVDEEIGRVLPREI